MLGKSASGVVVRGRVRVASVISREQTIVIKDLLAVCNKKVPILYG